MYTTVFDEQEFIWIFKKSISLIFFSKDFLNIKSFFSNSFCVSFSALTIPWKIAGFDFLARSPRICLSVGTFLQYKCLILNCSSSLLISSFDSSIFLGSKKHEMIPILFLLSKSISSSFNSALISSKGISVNTPAPSPVPSANLAPLWSRFAKHSKTFRVIPCVGGTSLDAIKPTPQESFSVKSNMMSIF